MDADFIVEQLESLSFSIVKPTFLVVDCARIHTGKKVQERLKFWQQRGLYLLYLPPYSPHLNLAETLWRKLKAEWLAVEDYLEQDSLFYATNRCLASVGTQIKINFSDFNLN
jgi:transposase